MLAREALQRFGIAGLRIHLGHHFYGAGNLGDDFMLAGFLAAMRQLAPDTRFTCCVPFALEPLRARFREIEWLPLTEAARREAIASCDAWLGLGGSPFQHALSRWFIDHLAGEHALCRKAAKPMYFLGIGIQSRADLDAPEIRRICAEAEGIWTRDIASAEWLASLPLAGGVDAAADVAHVFFSTTPPPDAKSGRVTLVPNFDYGDWPGRDALLGAVAALPAREHVWLAQESRELPGAERALHATLPEREQARWQLVTPEVASASLAHVLARWPSGEWLVTARYHAALAGAWSGSRVLVIATNEKLRAAARELGCPVVSIDADRVSAGRALEASRVVAAPHWSAERAFGACQAFVARVSGRNLSQPGQRRSE